MAICPNKYFRNDRNMPVNNNNISATILFAFAPATKREIANYGRINPSANRGWPRTNNRMSIRGSAPLFSSGYYYNVYPCPFHLCGIDVILSFAIHRIIHSHTRSSTHRRRWPTQTPLRTLNRIREARHTNCFPQPKTHTTITADDYDVDENWRV